MEKTGRRISSFPKITASELRPDDNLLIERGGRYNFKVSLDDVLGFMDSVMRITFETSVTLSPTFRGITLTELETGNTNNVIISDSGRLKVRTIDERVWGNTLVDYTDTSSGYIAKFYDDDTITKSVIFESDGYVGINTTSPSCELDIDGSLNVSDTITASSISSSGNITTESQLVSTVETGTSPISVVSTTVVDNLNSDMVDGFHASTIDVASYLARVYPVSDLVSGSFFGYFGYLPRDYDIREYCESPEFKRCVISAGHRVASGNANYSGRGTEYEYCGLWNASPVPILLYDPTSSGIPNVKVRVGAYCRYAYVEGSTEMYVCGYNGYGQLGTGDTTNRYVFTQVSLPGPCYGVFTHPTQNEHSGSLSRVFVKIGTSLYSCGYNSYGQLGVGDTSHRNVLTPCSGLTGQNIANVYPCGAHRGVTVVTTVDGKIFACGDNTNGALGLGDNNNRTSFVDITEAWTGKTSGVTVKYVGYSGCYFVTSEAITGVLLIWYSSDGVDYVKACGYNAHGQLATGDTTNRNIPVTIFSSSNITDVAFHGIGSGYIISDNKLYVWGYNGAGQLGLGHTNNVTTLTEVSNPSGLVPDKILLKYSNSYSYGHFTTVYIRYKKSVGGYGDVYQVYSCGYNAYGECGIGNTTTPITSLTRVLFPVIFGKDILKIDRIVAVTPAGSVKQCIAFDEDYTKMFAWGWNDSYSLRYGESSIPVPMYVKFPCITGFASGVYNG